MLQICARACHAVIAVRCSPVHAVLATRALTNLESLLPGPGSKPQVDAKFYNSQKETEANTARLTPEYLEMIRLTSLTNNTKIFFGPDIPTFFSSLGAGVPAE